MGNYEQLKNAIISIVKDNGNNEITGDVLQSVLLSIINSIGNGSTFIGVANPNTIPGVQDGNVFYIASIPGVYTNFGITIPNNTLNIITNKSGTWISSIIGEMMLSGGTQKTGIQLDTQISQSGVKFVYGKNRLNPNDQEGFNKILDSNGNIINSPGWYVTPLIRWDDATLLMCQRYRSSCQYDITGRFIVGSYNSTISGNTELNITVSKVTNSMYMRMSLPMTNKDVSMIVNGTLPSQYVKFEQIGSYDMNGGNVVFIPNISIDEKMQQWVLSESFRPTSTLTYTDGLINTPILVEYPDKGTGSINFVRDGNNNISSIEATHIESSRRMIISVTRDLIGNILTQSVIFSNLV